MSTSLRRVLHLAGLNESISDNPEVNTRIEQRLQNYPKDEQTLLLDAMEVLKNAGPQGLNPKEWGAAVRKIHNDPTMRLSGLLKAVLSEMGDVVTKAKGNRYRWTGDEGPNATRVDQSATGSWEE